MIDILSFDINLAWECMNIQERLPTNYEWAENEIQGAACRKYVTN